MKVLRYTITAYSKAQPSLNASIMMLRPARSTSGKVDGLPSNNNETIRYEQTTKGEDAIYFRAVARLEDTQWRQASKQDQRRRCSRQRTASSRGVGRKPDPKMFYVCFEAFRLRRVLLLFSDLSHSDHV